MSLVSKFPVWENSICLFAIKIGAFKYWCVCVYVAFSVKTHALAN